jgi:protein involved in polysaccharide export with SLBB domain
MNINKYKQIVYSVLFFTFCLSQGQSIQDMQKLKNEYEKFQKESSMTKLNTELDGSEIGFDDLPMNRSAQIYKPDMSIFANDSLDYYFGYDYFTLRDSILFYENLPSNSNYVLGPGDELIVSLWGQTLLRQTYTINREGNIFDDKVGLLQISGNTIEDIRLYLKNKFGQIYSTMNSKNPTTFIDVSLGALKSINVNFVGHIKYPGVYSIHSFSNIITGLAQAGGVDTTGSLRKIEIQRDGKLQNTIDLYDYFISGALASNIQLRDQDIIVVPPRQSRVEIDSAVLRPGIYESMPGESIHDLIQFAGGPAFNSSDKIGILRILPKEQMEKVGSYKVFYVDFETAKITKCGFSDKITLYPIFDELLEVSIVGQVKRPGKYPFNEGMSIEDLFSLSGGFKDEYFLKSIYLEQAEIIRRDPNKRYDSIIKLNLKKILKDSALNTIKLNNLDQIVIHENLNYFKKDQVYISGEVKIPGSYPLIIDNETLASILKRSGGLTSKALANGISIYRNSDYFNQDIFKKNLDNQEESFIIENENKVRVAWQNHQIALMPGDSIIVKESTGTVNVSGEVYNPGLIEFSKNKSLRKYINAAGGITDNGNSNSIIVVYASGVVSPKKWYSRPRIEDGATIIVNQKPPQEPFNLTQFASNWTSIISSMITAVVLSNQL